MSGKLSKTLALFAILVGTSIAPVAKGGIHGGQAAQGGAQAGSGGGGNIKEAMAQLDLTESQKQQIKKIMTEARASMQGAAKSGGRQNATSSTATGGQGKMRSGAGKEIMQKIMAVLTPEQKAKLKDIMKSARAKTAT